MGEDSVFVKREHVKIPITVWMEEPAREIREYIKIPKSGKVLAVREPTSTESGCVHYLTPKTSSNPHMSDREATILAVAKKYNMPARRVLKELRDGATFALDYETKLPFLDRHKAPLTKYTDLSNDSPEVAKIKDSIAKIHAEELMAEKLRQKANKFANSKRFAKKLEKMQSKR